MFAKAIALVRGKMPIIRRIRFEVTIPALCGIVWGLLAYFQQHKGTFDSIGGGFTAFFFIFFLQGQVLRVAKNVRDESNADEFRNKFVSIQEGLEELRGKKEAEAQAEEEADQEAWRLPEEFMEKGGIDIDAFDGDVLFSKPFFEEADHAFRQGALFPAMLSAAVGFEHALREVGGRYLDVGKKRPLGLILNELGKKDTTGFIVPTAKTLLQLRNGLVHGDNYDPEITAFEAVQIIWAFMTSVSAIQEMVAGWPALHFEKAVAERGAPRPDVDK